MQNSEDSYNTLLTSYYLWVEGLWRDFCGFILFYIIWTLYSKHLSFLLSGEKIQAISCFKFLIQCSFKDGMINKFNIFNQVSGFQKVTLVKFKYTILSTQKKFWNDISLTSIFREKKYLNFLCIKYLYVELH